MCLTIVFCGEQTIQYDFTKETQFHSDRRNVKLI